jgi:Ser/Thr protein kinase RdoA (MazF antagonist)
MSIDPVTAFQNLTPDELFDAIESKFLNARSIRTDGRFLALNSYENRVYQIGIEDADSIVAKFYRPQRWSDPAIIEEHQFTLDLELAEIPVIAPLVDDNNNTLHHHGPFRFAVYPCRGGRALEVDNPEHLEQMGRFVGRIHALGATASYQHRPQIDLNSYVTRPRQYLLDNHFIPAHLIDAYASLTTQLKDQIQHCFNRAGTVRQIRLHGDFHPGNVLWTEQGPHIVDFDDARTGPSIQDLWMFLSGDREYMTARLADILKGYSQFYDFDPVELHLVEALRTMRMIYHAGWLASRWEDPAFPIAFPWFNSMNYWENQILSLREQSALMDEAPVRWIEY